MPLFFFLAANFAMPIPRITALKYPVVADQYYAQRSPGQAVAGGGDDRPRESCGNDTMPPVSGG
ncbi:hypothetical protein [Paeniglutamicibacter sp. NPDC091659]|uniref:hypothetical protein n=1 Tax=Paeniglutamicibacter sp. NPDC091659 TaxID=3364389 RepID=UPI003806C5A6